MQIQIHNVETGEVVERDMSAEELAQWEIDQAVAAETAAAEAAKEAARQAVLDKLGLTADEVAALGL
jgi:hypothetical protein